MVSECNNNYDDLDDDDGSGDYDDDDARGDDYDKTGVIFVYGIL